ncbi:unnamed protein product [Pleuronectes platessa]|uniref:Uncharacterized protein n=1 Tax=Pleuronectes platessa TaxID=8262 RepID=A0A9N7YLB3_PLEPL|nr:unnamed protein product [Pleuronectes platessa]
MHAPVAQIILALPRVRSEILAAEVSQALFATTQSHAENPLTPIYETRFSPTRQRKCPAVADLAALASSISPLSLVMLFH